MIIKCLTLSFWVARLVYRVLYLLQAGHQRLTRVVMGRCSLQVSTLCLKGKYRAFLFLIAEKVLKCRFFVAQLLV